MGIPSNFFNEDFWRNLVAGLIVLIIGAIIMSTTAIATYKYVFRKSLSAGRTIAFFFALTVFFLTALVMAKVSLQPQIVEPAINSNAVAKLSTIQEDVQGLKGYESQEAALLWQPLKPQQKEAVKAAMIGMGTRRVFIWRDPTNDCIMLAAQFAGIAQGAGWNLLAPPSTPMGSEGRGITITTDETDPQLDNLKMVISRALSLSLQDSVGQQPTDSLPARGPDGKPYDIGIFVGTKSESGFMKVGTQQVPPRSKTLTVQVGATLPYSVTGFTTWGSTFTTTEVANGHFSVAFDQASPTQGPTQKFNWTIYRYE